MLYFAYNYSFEIFSYLMPSIIIEQMMHARPDDASKLFYQFPSISVRERSRVEYPHRHSFHDLILSGR